MTMRVMTLRVMTLRTMGRILIGIKACIIVSASGGGEEVMMLVMQANEWRTYTVFYFFLSSVLSLSFLFSCYGKRGKGKVREWSVYKRSEDEEHGQDDDDI